MNGEPEEILNPDEFITNWLNEHPDRAATIAHAALYGLFVELDEFGRPILNSSNIPDLNDLYEELAPVVEASSFADRIPSQTP